jgi:hypothetical protein
MYRFIEGAGMYRCTVYKVRECIVSRYGKDERNCKRKLII